MIYLFSGLRWMDSTLEMYHKDVTYYERLLCNFCVLKVWFMCEWRCDTNWLLGDKRALEMVQRFWSSFFQSVDPRILRSYQWKVRIRRHVKMNIILEEKEFRWHRYSSSTFLFVELENREENVDHRRWEWQLSRTFIWSTPFTGIHTFETTKACNSHIEIVQERSSSRLT